MDGDELHDGRVLRLGGVVRRFSIDKPKAMPADFRLSSADKNVGEGKEASLTVWDRARTTPEQARALVSGGGLRPVYRLNVVGVRSLGYRGRPPLRVVRDLESVRDSLRLPGAHGHCGIVGLQRPKGVPKKQRRALESELADLAELVEPARDDR